MRLNSSLWMLPDDPMDPKQWNNFDTSTWMQVVKPSAAKDDFSPGAIVASRFKTFHDLAKNIVADGELSIQCRRYLIGDDPPWEGADLRHGCLVWEIVDKSGRTTGTSFGGSLFNGLLKGFVHIDSDGLTETVETAPDPNFPAEYFEPGYLGTVPSAPWVIFREGEHTGIQSSSWKHKPATDVGVVAGGHSMPGTNEAISAVIIGVGGFLGSLFGQSQIGAAVDAVLRPIYTDTVLAWQKWRSPARARRLGASYYHEKFAEGGDRAYTLSAIIALRTGLWQTREVTSHTLVVADGSPYRIGQNGLGHFYIGDRVGSSLLGMPNEGRVYVDRVSELILGWDRKSSPSWQITIGYREPEDPLMAALSQIQDLFSIAKDLGVM